MAARFATELRKFGDSPALAFPGDRIVTFAALAARVESLTRSLGGGKKLIAIEAARSEHAIVAYLAGLGGGHAVAMLPADDRDAFDSFVERFRPDLIYRRVDGRWRFDEPAEAVAGELHPDLSLVLTTSGSTGHGKAVRLSGNAVAANAESIAEYLELGPSDRGALILPLHYSYGLSVLNSHLATGASIYIPGVSVLNSRFAAELRDSRCTNLAGVPHSYELLEAVGFRREELPDLRFMTVAGGALAPELARRYHDHLSASGKRLFLMYGQTEATARIAYLPPELAGKYPDRIGIAIPGGELRLIDERGETVSEPDVPGELVYRGPNVMMGYAESRADLGRGAEVDLLRTGDLAIRDGNGLYRVVGRLRRMSKIAGVRIAHDALEAAFARHGVAAAVIGDDRSVLAVYTSGHPQDEIRERLARATKLTLGYVNAVPVAELPRLPSGKVDYVALRARLATERPPQANGVEAAFRHAFFPHAIDHGQSFSALGGDSLRYLQLSIALERELGRIPAGWEDMTIAELSRLERQDAAGRTMTIGTDLVIRALAILLLVVQHATLWPVPGGAAAMVVLIGFGLARFQKDILVARDFGRFFRPLLFVLAPYYAILAGYALAWGAIPWASVLLAGNFGIADPERHSMLPYLYWFVEAFAQILLVWAMIFLIPPIRRFAARDPFRFGMGLLLAAMLLRLGAPQVWQIGNREIFTLPWVFYLTALGWCVHFADSRERRLAVLAAAAAIMPIVAYAGGNWIGSWIKYGLQFAVVGTLLYLPQVRLPTSLASLIPPITAGSYHIYLFHRFVPELMLAPVEADLPYGLVTLLAIAGGVALGIVVHGAQRAAIRLIAGFAAPDRIRRGAGATADALIQR